jgi:NodT family efflux transporter outer membrane factor (OMF) lipoprotein
VSAARHLAGLLALGLLVSGCPKVGPDYVPPEPTVADGWRDAAREDVDTRTPVPGAWWEVFGDAALGRLVDLARRQNPSLEAAAVRVLEARARRGIAVGGLYPQSQAATGAWTRVELSENRANQDNPSIDDSFDDWAFGGDAAWELDLWGRIRRGIEAADAELVAQVADYDDVLVSLLAEVVGAYVRLRVLDERLAVARRNEAIQRRSRDIADVKFRNEMVSELDVAQAETLLATTTALVATLEADRRATENLLAVLLGLPPQDLDEIVGGGDVPAAPPRVAVGVPAELLRRRPDVRRLERQLAAQSARIGIAKADLLPRLSLTGVFTVAAEDFADLGTTSSIDAFGGPTLRWAILNYGRITNNVRVQDARFQALIARYEATVLRAQQEVEDAIVRLVRAHEEVVALERAVDASRRSVDISQLQYREGLVDYIRVLNAHETLLSTEERLVGALGEAALQVVALYRSLGGGWEVRLGDEIVPADVVHTMRDRTWWGGLTAGTDDPDADARAPWWRRWLPRW